MQSHYRINVAFHGRHFFATAEGSLVTRESAVTVYKEIRRRFPESEGFTITVTHWTARGEHLNFDGESDQ